MIVRDWTHAGMIRVPSIGLGETGKDVHVTERMDRGSTLLSRGNGQHRPKDGEEVG